MLGIPPDVVDATEHLLSLADNWRTRVVDLGRAGDRHFLFSAGVGLDAEVVRHVDAHPRLKSRFGEYYYSWVAARTFSRHYLLHPPRLEASLAGGEDSVRGATVIVQNSSPYAYFGDRAVEMAEGARLDSGDLAWLALKRTSPFDMPTIAWRALSSHRRVIDHRQIVGFSEQASVRVRSLDDRPLPLQVDGDYIGRFDEIEFSVVPAALKVLA
jgi:diacylglycerol kinase family enzyme